MKSESQLQSWEHKTTAWKCCSFLQKKEEKESESSYFQKPLDFMNIWDLRHTKEQTMMKKEIHIRFYI